VAGRLVNTKSAGVVAVIAIAAALAYVALHRGRSASPESSAPRNPSYESAKTSASANHDTAIVTGTYAVPQQVDVIAEPPIAAVAPGQRFALTLSVAPRANMHVYAPGADGYKTVALTIAPSPYVHARPLAYPASEIYEFKPLNERVPAYQKPFTLVQEMTLDGSAATRAALRDQRSLTISGRFDYQACDDGTCYNPASMPLTWTIDLK
jgi:hypothetical protein